MKVEKLSYDPNKGPQIGDYVEVGDRCAPCSGVARVAYVDRSDGTYLVEFLEEHAKLHNGNTARGARCKDHRGWWVAKDMIMPIPIDCQLFHLDTTTYCQVNGRISGKAECDEKDSFDPLTGAIIALARAYGTNPTAAAYKVLEVLSAVPKAEPAKAETEVKPSPKLEIRSIYGDEYGKVGTRTKYCDRRGVPLYVGDTVSVRKRGSNKADENWVVETNSDGAFVMGLCSLCDPKTGHIDADWEIEWLSSYRERAVGDRNYTRFLRIEAPEVKRVLRSNNGLHYGVLGAPTDLVDRNGTELRVGDQVNIYKYGDHGLMISCEPVVCNEKMFPSMPDYVMGLAGVDFSKDAKPQKFTIKKVGSYQDLRTGEKLSDGWLIVKEE